MFANLSLNGRRWVAALATAVVASGIGLVVALVSPSGTGGGGVTQAIATPTPLIEEESPLPEESPVATESATPEVSPSPTASPATSPVPTSGNRDPSTIDCDREPRFCSNVTGTMTVRGGRLQSFRNLPSRTDYSGVPLTRMMSTVLKPNQQPARNGDQVGWIKVRVDVINNTDRTFVFPQRKVALVVRHNNKEDVNETIGPRTEVPPGGALHADFLNPEIEDGVYRWRAKVWFYAK